jgi:GAF domain-containing protein
MEAVKRGERSSGAGWDKSATGGSGAGPVHIALPLVSRGLTLGALGLVVEQGPGLAERLALIDVVADLCSTALDRALLYEAEHEARRTLEFLAAGTQLMISAVDPEEVVDHLVHLAVPRLGDWCTAYLADGPWLRRVAMAIDGHPELAEHLKAEPLSLDVDVPQTRAYRRGIPEPIPSGVGRLLTGLYPDLDFSAMGGDLDGGSGLCAPVMLRGERLGVIALAFVGSGRRVTPRVVDAMVGLAGRAAMALDNARRWSEQRTLVQALVAALLPHQPPSVPGYEVVARYIPSGGGVAGDWWEADLMPDGALLVGVGDAAGHGMAGASLMAELRYGARALAGTGRGPAALLADLSHRLGGTDRSDTFATAIYGRLDLDDHHLRWANAGHLPPVLVTPDGQARLLYGPLAPPLGAPPPAPAALAEDELVLGPGEVLALYSDGIVERRGEALDVGIASLAATLADGAGVGALDDLADAVVARYCQNPADDCCLLLIRRSGP